MDNEEIILHRNYARLIVGINEALERMEEEDYAAAEKVLRAAWRAVSEKTQKPLFLC